MLTDPTHCEQKVPCRTGLGFDQCQRPWDEEVEVEDVEAGDRLPRRFCGEHAREARGSRGYGVLLVRRPEPLYTYRFRTELVVTIGPVRTEDEARRALARLLRPLVRCVQPAEGDADAIILDGEPELANGAHLAAWERGVAENEE